MTAFAGIWILLEGPTDDPWLSLQDQLSLLTNSPLKP